MNLIFSNMKRSSLIALCAVIGAVSSSAVTINFEDVAVNTVIDNQYVGLGADFNGTAGIGRQGVNLNPLYPAHSGLNIAYDLAAGGIRVDAIGGDWASVSGYITGTTLVTLRAFDSVGNLLGTDSTSGANYTGVGTPNDLLSIIADKIAYVTFSDSGNTFTLDDFSFERATNVPEVPATFSLLGLGLASLIGFRRGLRS
jgi:hypothetical protein